MFAQDIGECRKIVELTIESINRGSCEGRGTYLSDDFTIAGQKGEMAKLVLNQLFTQLGDKVDSYQEIKQIEIDKGLKLVYNISYMEMGLKEAAFIFTESNLLKELSLFKMEVKTMSSDTKVEKSSQDVIEIPFTMAGNLIAVKVRLNGEYKTFILDSGSPKVILNSKYIAEKDTTGRKISSSKGVSGNISGMDITKVEEMDFSGIQLNNQDVITLDLSHLEESLETDLYGLIGYELIKDYDIIFDYESLKLVLINPDIYEVYKSENLSDATLETVPFDLEGHIPIVKAQVGEKYYSYGIDCGAESNLISQSLFESLKKHTKRVEVNELIGADNQPKKVKKGMIKETKIGTKYFKNLMTAFSDISHLNEGYKINIDGLIGYEILHRQKTLISYSRKEMMFIE
jgi:hypothetical protein